MSGQDDRATGTQSKIWSRRPYAGKRGRELLNDISRFIARTRPDAVEDPTDPCLADVLRCSGRALDPDTDDIKGDTLARLMDHGLSFREAVCWYWFRYCEYDLTEIHYAMSGSDVGGDPKQRRNATRNILSTLQTAAQALPDADPDCIPDLVDDRKRHDRADDPDTEDIEP